MTPHQHPTADDLVNGCRIIDLPRIHDHRGNLTFVEGGIHIPFDVGRVYYLYDVPGGESRAGHAHKALEQLVIAVSGSFDVLLDDGHERRTVTLNRGYHGLYMSNSVWREIHNFSSGAVCLVLASMRYEEEDYIRDYHDFLESVHGANTHRPPVRSDAAGQWVE